MVNSRGGELLSPKLTWMFLPDLEKLHFSTLFSPIYPTISIPFSIEKHPILPRLGAFYNNLTKLHFGYLHL